MIKQPITINFSLAANLRTGTKLCRLWSNTEAFVTASLPETLSFMQRLQRDEGWTASSVSLVMSFSGLESPKMKSKEPGRSVIKIDSTLKYLFKTVKNNYNV